MVAEIGGALVTGTTASAGDCVGVVTHDALGGASDGAIRAEIMFDRIFKFTAGTNAPTDATPMYANLYMEDDNHVGTGAAGQRFAGLFVGFEDDGLVRVYIGHAAVLRLLTAQNGTNLADVAAQSVGVLSDNTRYTFPTMSQASTVNLSTTNAQVGDTITITRTDTSANTLTVHNSGPGANDLAILVVSKAGFVKAWFDGTNWNLDSVGHV
jgi:VCBS repeat-containing protein